jgi:hypothetical protein
VPNILHRLTIDAPTEHIADLQASREGIEQWWTGYPVIGDDSVGGQLSVYFIDPALKPTANGGTTLLFSHEGWKKETEFMSGCSTDWAAYLMSLEAGAEGHGFNPYPGGEISRSS